MLSPHGHGLDCHRTWEILLLGSFPVVASSTLNSMYDGLPVVIVNRWEDISYELLLKKARNFELLDPVDVEQRLLFPHWQQRVEAAQSLAQRTPQPVT